MFTSNALQLCSYCGERMTGKAKYCKTCTTAEGRKKIFDANVAIIKENAAKGHTVPSGLKDWH
jgi:predicted amidophosphoribosyltransferase